jgi:hypothetical protein
MVSKITKALEKLLGYQIFLDCTDIDVFQESYFTKAEKSKINTDAILLLNNKVNFGEITRDIAVLLLVTEWGFDSEEAEKFIMYPKEMETNADNENII